MTELKGQVSIFDVIEEETDAPSAARALKVLDLAKELGWTVNPVTSMVIRLTRGDGIPFFARWDLSVNPDTAKKSWSFQGARAANGQPLNYNDIKVYLNDPTVILPEEPVSPEEEESLKTALGALKILDTEPDPSYIAGPKPGSVISPVLPSIPGAGWGVFS